MNLALNLTHSAALRPDRPALICGETQISYAQLEAASAGVAARLRRSGELVPAPKKLGSRAHKATAKAPGTHVIAA
jgi:non-ribosomal peptide synthetase component E (peptide arylation enzyme)